MHSSPSFPALVLPYVTIVQNQVIDMNATADLTHILLVLHAHTDVCLCVCICIIPYNLIIYVTTITIKIQNCFITAKIPLKHSVIQPCSKPFNDFKTPNP